MGYVFVLLAKVGSQIMAGRRVFVKDDHFNNVSQGFEKITRKNTSLLHSRVSARAQAGLGERNRWAPVSENIAYDLVELRDFGYCHAWSHRMSSEPGRRHLD
jgi:hypothetical protein